MSRFEHHIFVCTNERPADHPKGSCGGKSGVDVRLAFVDELKARGLRGKVRANKSGCLDACSHGVCVVVYPEGTWYGGVTVDDVAEIIQRHIVNGDPVDRLQIASSQFREAKAS